MGNFRPLPTTCWEKFLTYKGFSYKRTSGSHDIWTQNGFRSIPVWGDEKEIPPQHIKTSCRTIKCDISDVYNWAKENC